MVYNSIFKEVAAELDLGAGWFKISEAGLTNVACKELISSLRDISRLSDFFLSTSLGNARSSKTSFRVSYTNLFAQLLRLPLRASKLSRFHLALPQDNISCAPN
jgi:hypothetical protein